MHATEKFRSDLDQALRRAGERPAARLAAARGFFERQFPALGPEARGALMATFAAKWEAGPEPAIAWLSGLGSILNRDYDGTPLPLEDWVDLRESFSLDADSMDMELLEYVMGLVVDHGAL